MSDLANKKPIPRSILIFGAAAHIGRPLAEFIHREDPQARIRLASSNAERAGSLARDFPYAEAVHADYFDQASLESAVDGIEGVFVVTGPGTDERRAMTNLVGALRRAGTVTHILRIVGLQPEANPRRFPDFVRKAGMLPVEHPIAKAILDESDLPVTYLNCGATFMDNFFRMKEGLSRERKLVWHDRLIPFLDTRDIAEVAGRLFLSDDNRHIGQFHTLNNGHDLMRYSEVAELMTEVFGEKITHDSSRDGFLKAYSQRIGPERASGLWDFFEYEKQNEVVWARNDFVERTLGRKPLTLSEWLQEHAQLLLT